MNRVAKQWKSSDSNQCQRFLVLIEEQPKCASRRSTRAWATVTVVMPLMSTASDHRVKRSTHAKK